MAHLVLYRNFRPTVFEEVIGQDHIVKTLQNQIMSNNFGHAYLLSGTRGTGKTSCARIFAHAINCEHTNNGSPCGKCPACVSNLNGGGLDIIEIDAASNNRVDEIRDLREKIGYLPTVGKYKIYIIDEVHMLTDSAFNALLKTLEEPPAHVVFLLATTEPHKLPATILSRCMRFDFKLISEENLAKHIKFAFEKSGIKSDNESLKLIARFGEGSVRDALSVAEMCAAYTNNNVTYQKCLECLGVTNNEILNKIVTAIADRRADVILNTVAELSKTGKNLAVLVKDITNYVKTLLTIKIVDNAKEMLELPSEHHRQAEELASRLNEGKLIEWLQVLSSLDNEIRFSTGLRTLVETVFLKMIYTEQETDTLKKRIEELEKKSLNEDRKTIITLESKPKNKPTVVRTIKNLVNEVAKTANVKEDLPQKIIKQEFDVKIDIKNSDKTEQIIAEGDDNKEEHNVHDAKKVFGELVVRLRKGNYPLLYATCGDIDKFKISHNILIIYCKSASYDIFSKNITILNKEIKEISENLTVSLIEIKDNQAVSEEDILRQKFKDKLIIE